MHDPLKPRGEDLLYKGVVTLGTAVLGSAAGILLFLREPFSKRLRNWAKLVERRLRELEKKHEYPEHLKLNNLINNEKFITVYIKAARYASADHSKEKHELLCNAVLNCISPEAPEEAMQDVFIRYIDELTPWHLRVLKLAYDPLNPKHGDLQEHFESDKGAAELQYAAINFVWPEYFKDTEKSQFLDAIINDLKNKNLLKNLGMFRKHKMTGKIIVGGANTYYGKKFIDFITSPIEGTINGE